MTRPVVTLRFESKAQMENFRRAARARRWSLNTFMLAAAEEMAMEVLGGEAMERGVKTAQMEVVE